MANQCSHHSYPQYHFAVDAQNYHGQEGQALIDDDLHPVETHIADPIELYNAVVQFVKLP